MLPAIIFTSAVTQFSVQQSQCRALYPAISLSAVPRTSGAPHAALTRARSSLAGPAELDVGLALQLRLQPFGGTSTGGLATSERAHGQLLHVEVTIVILAGERQAAADERQDTVLKRAAPSGTCLMQSLTRCRGRVRQAGNRQRRR